MYFSFFSFINNSFFLKSYTLNISNKYLYNIFKLINFKNINNNED